MTGHGQRGEKHSVLIAGVGIAGVETALALRDLASDRVEVTLCDSRSEFVFRPFAIGKPYGAARIFRYDLQQLAARCGAVFRRGDIVSVDPQGRVAVSREGSRFPYDYLVVAGGVRTVEAIPGAVTFWGAADEGQVGDLIAGLRDGTLGRLAFAAPRGRSWTMPLYELALLGVTESRKATIGRTRITLVTPEKVPLELFGSNASEQMARLLGDRGIELLLDATPVKFDGERLRVASGEEIEVDAVVGLPRLEGRRIAGIPHDPDGFVEVDGFGRVSGLERVFAAGDITTFPVKQAGIVTQQADAVAEGIAAATGWSSGRGKVPELDEQLQWLAQDGEVTGRYLTPFLDLLSEDAGSTESIGSPSRC